MLAEIVENLRGVVDGRFERVQVDRGPVLLQPAQCGA